MTKIYKIEVCLLFAIRIVYCVYYYYFISLLTLLPRRAYIYAR